MRAVDRHEGEVISNEHEEDWIARTLLANVMPEALESLRRCSPPGPDFLFKGLIDPIGLEVTTLRGGTDASGRPLAAAEGTEAKILGHAQRRHHELSLPPAQVFVIWNPAQPPVSRKATSIAEAVVEAVAAGAKVETSFCSVRVSGSAWPGLSPTVESILIWTGPTFRQALYQGGSGAFVPDLTAETIVAALDAKERKVPSYRTFAQEIWCGLGILGIQGSSVFSVPITLGSASFRSSFDRVYIVSVVPEQIVELDISRGAVEQHRGADRPRAAGRSR
jgi:hypothetical protein